MNQATRLYTLNRNQLKYLVIIAMLIDHLAWAFVPTDTVLAQIMHFVGRLTGPTMAFFVVEGYIHTRNIKKYAQRLALFALVSWPAFVYFEFGIPAVFVSQGSERVLNGLISFYFAPFDCMLNIVPQFGVIYTLFLSLIALWVYDKAPWQGWCKGVVITLLCLLSIYGDWPIFDIMFVLCLFKFRDEPKKKWGAFCLAGGVMLFVFMGGLSGEFVWKENICQLGIFIVPILLQFGYNGESGSKKPFHKWFFYIFYPLHLLILGIIKYVVVNKGGIL